MHKRLSLLSFLILMTSLSACAGVITPNPNLVVDGIPEMSDEIISKTKDYTDFRPTGLADVHPITQAMLVITRPKEEQVAQLHEIEKLGAPSRKLTSSPDAISSATYQPIDGKFLVFAKDVNGTEKHQLYRLDLEGDKVTLLTDGNSKNGLGPWSHQGDRIAFTSNRRNSKDFDIYVMNPLKPESTVRIIELGEGDSWSILDWSRDDQKLLAMRYITRTESSLWLIDLKTGKKELLLNGSGVKKIAYGDAKYSKDGKALYALSNQRSEFVQLVEIDLKNLKHRAITRKIPWDIEEFSLSHDGKKIAFISNEAGVSKVYHYDVRSKKYHVASGLPIAVMNSAHWRGNDQELLLGISGARSPSDVFSYNFQSSNLKQLTKTETAIDVNTFAIPKLVEWKSFDGRMISGFLYQPTNIPAGKKVPVEVVIHGGPEAQFRPGFLGRSNYHLNEMGVALLYPNIRGSSGYGKTFLDSANGLRREDAYADLDALFNWIKAQKELDGNRIFVTGGSYGGHSTLVVATRYPDKIKCALSVVGMSNLVTFLENTDPYRQDLRRAVYGDERDPQVRAFLERIAPINNTDKVSKPLFIVQGLMDPRVPHSEAIQMVNNLKAKGIAVWFLEAKNEGHGFSKKENADFQFYSTIEFMKRFL
jgi:dipeptidyl aminopeptidase/acylaminoacyl peptidase